MLLEVSRALQRYLHATIPQSSGDWVEIAAAPQGTGAVWPDGKLVLFLYAVGEETHLRNAPFRATEDGYIPPPLQLVLHYLVTYVSTDHEEEQRRLDRVLQAFYSRPRFGPAELNGVAPQVDYLTVRLRTLSAEELNRIWTALNQGLRLALFYEVGVVPIASLAPETVGPVLELRGVPEPV
ncbi:MAG: DUF4255 domain-containing protein [Gaiellaceae bacterium]